MKVKFYLIIIFAVLNSCVLYSQQNTLKLDMKYTVKTNVYDLIPDVPNHKLGLATGTGSAMLKDGQSALVSASFIYDYINGSGEFDEYYTLTFQDNSSLIIEAQGKSTDIVVEGSPLFNATVEIVGGTGTYNGIKGSGKFTGSRNEVLEEGAIIKLSFEIVTIKK